MKPAKVYLDEDVHGLIADSLRLRNHQITTTPEAGQIGSSDSEQLEFATRNGRVIVSYNVTDFPRLHYETLAQGKHHAGIVVGTQDDPKANAKALLALLDAFSADDFRDELLYLNNWI